MDGSRLWQTIVDGSFRGVELRLDSSLNAPKVVQGIGALDRLTACVADLGMTHVTVIADGHDKDVVIRLGAALAGRIGFWTSAVEQHVPLELARVTTADSERHGSDGIVCLGGGSATGLAKAVARRTGLPIVAIPTTFAGSEMTSVWGETEGSRKLTGRDADVMPRVVLYDPPLTMSLPPALAAVSGLNALAHAVEIMWAPSASPSDLALVAAEAIHLLVEGLPPLVHDGDDMTARVATQRGACLAGVSLANGQMGIHHKLCHVLGGMGFPHAPTHAVILPATIEWHQMWDQRITAPIAEAMESTDALTGIRALSASLDAPRSLRELGFAPVMRDQIVEAVVNSSPPCVRPITNDSVAELLDIAISGW